MKVACGVCRSTTAPATPPMMLMVISGTMTRGGLRQAFPVGEDARHRSRPDRHGVGGIGGNGKNSGKNERGKREETAAAGDRIHGAGQYRGREEKNRLGKSHRLVSGKAEHRNSKLACQALNFEFRISRFDAVSSLR